MRAAATGRVQAGSALVLALLFMALLAGLGIPLLLLTGTNLERSRGQLDARRSFLLAESGVEDGRRTLFDANAAAEEFGARLADAAGDNGVLDFDPHALDVTYDGNGNFTGVTGYGDDVPLRPITVVGSSGDTGWYAGFLSNDPLDGRTSLSDANGRVIVTGVGVGPNHTFQVVEAIVEPEILLPPLPPAAVTLLGSNPHFSGGQSNAESYHGEDCYFLDGGVPGLNVPIVGTTDPIAESLAESGMNGPASKYTSGGYTGGKTGVDLTDPSDPLVRDAGMGTLDPRWNDCRFLKNVVDGLRDDSTYSCSPPDCTLPDFATDQDIIFVDGDVRIGPGYIGAGILVVTGKLEIPGNSSWTGVVLAIGEGHIRRVGGGNGVISGTTIVADIAGPNESYGDADDCQPVPDVGLDADDSEQPPLDTDPFGNSHYQVVGGGNSDIDFCSRFLFTDPRSYRIVDFRPL